MAVLGPFNLSKGFSPAYNFFNSPDGFVYEQKNCRIVNGFVAPRKSLGIVNASQFTGNTYVTGLTGWIDAANSVTALVAISNAKIYTADATTYTPISSSLTFTDRTGATTISSSTSLRYTFDSLNGVLIVAGNSAAGGVVLKVTAYNANAAVLAGTPPKADSVKVVNNIAFLGRQLNSATTYATLTWSNINDPETWTAANTLEVGKKDGEPIMALGAIGNDLFIFKQTSIWRLSTTTITTAGAVTLGPLQQVVRGIGCCGPLALDNLPNGNIVFVGYDGHFYEFDGSTPVDLSRQPYPGPNAYNSSQSLDVGGLDIGVASTRVVVKTWRGIGEVWINYDVVFGSVTTATAYTIFAYDYQNGIWQGHISDITPKVLTTLPMAGYATSYFESSDIMFHGNSLGNIFSHGTISAPTNESLQNVDFRVAKLIELSNDAGSFVPRSIYAVCSVPAAAGITSLVFYVKYDGPYAAGDTAVATYTGTQLAANPRVVIPVPIKQESSTGPLPSFMTITLIGTCAYASGLLLDTIRINAKFYVSDEIIR